MRSFEVQKDATIPQSDAAKVVHLFISIFACCLLLNLFYCHRDWFAHVGAVYTGGCRAWLPERARVQTRGRSKAEAASGHGQGMCQ